MAQDDFDLDTLASYLHLTPNQVTRLASRDKIPGRKVGGEWRFSRAEVHLWLEERIGCSDDSELQQMENVLDGQTQEVLSTPASLCEMMTADSILYPLAARTRGSVIDGICAHAANLGLLWDTAKMADAIRTRERLHSTALDNGVALLHPRRPMPGSIAEPFLILARSQSGIPFGGARGNLTDLFFLIASTEDQGHLRTLARLSRILGNSDWLAQLRDLSATRAMFDLICAADEQLDKNS